MSNEQQNERDKARLKSWEGGEYIAVNNVRETACDTAHWGWVRGFNEGFDAGAASVDRVEVVEEKLIWKRPDEEMPAQENIVAIGAYNSFNIGTAHELRLVNGMVAWCLARDLGQSAMDAVLAAMEKGK